MARTDGDEASKVDIRRLLGLALPHWKMLALATVTLMVGSGIVLLYPQAARVLVDDVFAEDGGVNIATVGMVLLALFLFQSVMVSVRYYLFSVIGERVVADLRKELFSAVVGREMGFFDSNKTGELTSRLASDTQVLQSAVTTNVSMALRYGVQAIGGIIVLFVTSVKLSLIIVVLLPLVVGIAMYYGRQIRKLSRRVQDAIADSTSFAEEALSGIRTVRSFAREAHEKRRYERAIEHSFDLARYRARLGAFFSGGTSFLGYSTIAVVLWMGGTMVMAETMTPGELTAYILYVLFVAFSLGALSSLWADFARAVGSGERVFSLIDAQLAPHVNGLAAGLSDVRALEQGDVVFDAVSFSYPTRPDELVLDQVSFHLAPGERLALVGASGSGKSTIASLVSGFYDAGGGAIHIDGREIGEFDATHLRESIGMVAQEPVHFSGTVRENVLYGRPDATEEEVVAALESANAWDFVSGFAQGIETIVGERGVRLSGGQKQRIAIARALLKDPIILILDEATSALDVESESLVQRALETLMEGRTTLIIAHRLSTIAGADAVVVLERGRVIERGTHAELMAQGSAYHRMVEMQLVAR